MNAASNPRQQQGQQTLTGQDRPKSSSSEQSEDKRNVSGLVLDARCEMAMARVAGPLDVRTAFDHCRRARRCAFRAGAASASNTDLPLMFDGSPTLIGAWLSGQNSRPFSRPLSSPRPPPRLSLIG